MKYLEGIGVSFFNNYNDLFILQLNIELRTLINNITLFIIITNKSNLKG
jgi:hypothetical protein